MRAACWWHKVRRRPEPPSPQGLPAARKRINSPRVKYLLTIITSQGQPANPDGIHTRSLFPVRTAELRTYMIQTTVHRTPLQHRGAVTIRILFRAQPPPQAGMLRIITCNLMKSSTAGRGPLRPSLPSEKPQRMEACYCEPLRRLYYEWHGCDNQNFGCSYFQSMRVYGRNHSYLQILSF